MALKYLAGNRIQGSSALESQTTVGTTFNLRFDFEVDSYPSGTGASGSYGLWSKDKGTDANTGGQDFVQLYNNDGVKHKLWVGKNTMAYGGSSTAIGGSWINLSIGTQYYVEIVGNGDDTYTLNIRTSSHGGSHVSGSPQTVNASSLSSLADMKYFGFKNTVGSSNGGTVTKIDSLEIYNGTTSASGSADITDAFSSDGQWTFTTSEVDITGGVLETTMNRGGNDSATRTLLAYTDERPTPSGSIEITTDSHRVASSTHGTFSTVGSGAQENWYCYSSDSSGYRSAQQYTASQFSSIPSGATVTGVKYSGGSQRYYGGQSNPKLVGMSTAPHSHTSVSSFISDVQGSSTVYVADSGFADSTYSGNGGTPVPFTDTFNSTGVAYVVNAIANGDDVFFGFQSTDVSGNTGYYGFGLTGTSQAKLTIEYSMPSEPQLVDGTIFEYTDTGKHYIWNSSTSKWTEIA